MRSVLYILVAGLLSAVAQAAPVSQRSGDAIVANLVGDASVYLFDGPVHEGRRVRKGLHENSSVGPTAQISTGKDGQLCMVLSPGAQLCVAPNSTLTFDRLDLTADGLPQKDEDLVRRIHIKLQSGRILLHAGPPVPTLDIQVSTDAGVVEANGGTFSVAQQQDGSWAVFNEADEQTVVAAGKPPVVVSGGLAVRLGRTADGTAEATFDEGLQGSELRTFEVCEVFFEDLALYFKDPLRLDRQGLASYIGGEGANVNFLGGDRVVADASPSVRPVTAANVETGKPTAGEPGGGGRWTDRRIWDWYNGLGPVKGVNYIPRYAVNSVEMWMEASFDAEIIDEELAWAHDAGYTSVRVPLQFAVWSVDPDGFLKRFKQFLEIADRNGLHVVPVLFDDLNLAGREPAPEPQPAPEPGRHNSRWLPSPGPSKVADRAAWPALEEYVKAVIKPLRRDDRVLFWDLYNVAGAGPEWEASLPLMDQAFNWARNMDPSQPLAVAAWTRFGSAMTTRKLERSDLITFQSFDPPEQVEALLMRLRRYERPIICTDWLMRQRGSDFASMLPVFSSNKVGWFNNGLVNGRTQKWVQQEQFRSNSDPELWQQDILREDGKPYREEEIRAIQAFKF